jgi:hypothetical protein
LRVDGISRSSIDWVDHSSEETTKARRDTRTVLLTILLAEHASDKSGKLVRRYSKSNNMKGMAMGKMGVGRKCVRG